MATGAVALQLLGRHDDQPCPAGEEAEAAEGSDSTEPVRRLPDQRHQIQASAEKKNSGKKQPPSAATDGSDERESEQSDGVNKMIKDSLVPDIQHAVQLQSRFQAVRSERSQRYGQETKRSRNSNKQNRHTAQICHSERSRGIPNLNS